MNAANIVVAGVISLAVAGMGVTQAADKNPGFLKMALINIKCAYSDTADAAANKKVLEANIARHMYFIDKVTADGAEFVGFPEASINGYHYSPNMTWLSRTGPEVKAFQKKAKDKGIYISAGLAEVDDAGKKWEAQFVVDPQGQIIGWHRKIELTAEKKAGDGVVQAASEHEVFEVKGVKMGIIICAEGTFYNNLKALADGGAKIIYGPHANTTGSTIAGWYNFRKLWGGPWDGKMVMGPTDQKGGKAEMPSGGWCAQLKVYAAIHNHAGLYNPEYNPPPGPDSNNRFASGAWFIGPDGKTLAQMPTSTDKSDSKEYVLIQNIPLK